MASKTNGNQNEYEKKPVAKLPNRKYGFFRDDQIRFLVTHPGNGISTGQLRAFQDYIDGYLGEYGAKIQSDVLTFPEITDEQTDIYDEPAPKVERTAIPNAFSLLRCSLEQGPEDPSQLLKILQNLLDDEKFGKESIEGLTIQGLSPEWLTSVVSQGSGTGGPGGVPSPYYGSRKNAHYTFDLVNTLKGCGIYGDGTGVDVIILDTAPSTHDLVAAHKEWPDHPLIGKLLGPEGKLHLYPTSYQDTLRLGNLSLNGSDYKLTDHGLFIAGIIHSIVPEAEIHLIEVLNQYGVGDYTAFTKGMWKALYSSSIGDPGRKRVINCSWMLDFPVNPDHCYHTLTPSTGPVNPDLEFENEVMKFVDKNQRAVAFMLEAFFNRAYDRGWGAIAAAGNDAYDDEQSAVHIRPKARYPAALTRVRGVGALPPTLEKYSAGTPHQGKYKTSVFSNRSDRPEYNGIATLGGEEGEGKGILGLYIGEFPDGRRNISKWAWWAGTSFATPILTGAVASLLSNDDPIDPVTTTEGAIRKLYTRKIIKNNQTEVSEDVLPTVQC